MQRDPGSPANAMEARPAALPMEDPYEYRTTLGCGNKTDPDANDNPTNCTYGMTVCATPDNPGGILYYSWFRRRGVAGAPWGFNGESCSLAALPAAPPPPAIPSLAMIRDAFAQLPFAKPTVRIQPVGGRTLVNLPTYYEIVWDDSGLEPGSVSPPQQMLSWSVEFEVLATEYEYRFGDGSSSGRTTDTGGPYPTGNVRHTYTTKAGHVGVSADAWVTARWRANGGAWQDIQTVVQVSDPPVTPLEVLEAQAQLVTR